MTVSVFVGTSVDGFIARRNGAFDKQRHVAASLQRHLRAGDRPHPERLRRVRELERPVDPVVVGERQRLVPELGRTRRKLLRV